MESSALVVAVAVPEAVEVTAEEETTTIRDSAICSDLQPLPKDKMEARLPTLSTLRSQVVPVEAATIEAVAEATVETQTSVAEVADPATDGKRPGPTRVVLQTTTKT